jgi:hypothetical protein
LVLACPTCGAEHSLRNPGITVVVCTYCSATIYREEAALRAGKKSMVAEPRSNLRVDKQGTVGGQSVTLIGRVQFEHATGRWDEWVVEEIGSELLWLVEDEKTYVLEHEFHGDLPVDVEALQVGQVFELEGGRFEVREIGEGRCVGGEGQLPRGIQPGERYRFIDCIELAGNRVVSIEAGPDGHDVFVGEDVPADQVVFSPEEFEPSVAVEGGQRISCPNCGGHLELPGRGEPCKTLGCTYCEALITLEGAVANLAGMREGTGADLELELGAAGTLQGTAWEVMGRLIYREFDALDTREYLLWNAEDGYGWLEEYGGNWTLQQPTRIGPALTELAGLIPRRMVLVGEKEFRFLEQGQLELAYVDGALPWLATIGTRHNYVTLVKPPRIYTIEWVELEEIERFIGEHVASSEIAEAFELSSPLESPTVQGAAAPNKIRPNTRRIAKAAVFFGLLNLFQACSSLGAGREVALVRLAGDEGGILSEEQEGMSEAFEVPEGARTLALELKTRVKNDWTYITAELLSVDGEQVLGTTGREVSYYSGVEGGESWSEGNQKGRLLVKAPPPGRYLLQISQESGGAPGIVEGRVHLGARTSRYYFWLGALFLVFAGVVFAFWQSAENERFGISNDD